VKVGQDELDIKCTECVVVIRKDPFYSLFIIHKGDKSNFARYPMTPDVICFVIVTPFRAVVRSLRQDLLLANAPRTLRKHSRGS